MRALNAFIKLVRAADSVSGRVEAYLAPLKLTVSQFGVLETLFHVGPLYQKELGQKILKSSGNITMVVDNLEKSGFVQRIRDEQDRRRYTVHLTAKGRRIIQFFFPRHVSRIVEEMSVLTKAEMDELGRLCRKVGLGRTQNAAK
ncbi:MAG TPA: MarR family transcriptional regulator [Nitrospirota bacterium]|nr:MarR family transcriptional regulator [Nitrospirota bacterium]